VEIHVLREVPLKMAFSITWPNELRYLIVHKGRTQLGGRRAVITNAQGSVALRPMRQAKVLVS
jgi:hypothetical protein